MQVPNGDVSVGAAGEADFWVGGDGEGVACGSHRIQLALDPGGGAAQVPDGEGGRFATHDEGPAVWQEFAGPNIIVPVEALEDGNGWFERRLTDVPDFDTTLTPRIHMTRGVRYRHRTDHLKFRLWAIII